MGAKLWKNKEIELIAKLVDKGYSAAMIALNFKGRTRNSVIGVCHRNGIKLLSNSKKETSPKVPKSILRKKKPKQLSLPFMVAPKLLLPSKEEEVPYTPVNKTILELDNLFLQCRAILGPVKGMDTLYCGNAVAEGTSWCKYHLDLYTVPPNPRRGTTNGNSQKPTGN